MEQKPSMSAPNAKLLPPLALAYMGDAVWEIHARARVLRQGEKRPNRLHRSTVRYANAKAQAEALRAVWEQLSEEEQSVVRRARNAKSASVPKNADVQDYRHATALEALIGYLYLSPGQGERMEQLLADMMNAIDHQSDGGVPDESK